MGGRWAPVQHSGGLNRIPASPNAAAGSENYPSSSYVTLTWSHALCDGPSMMAFLSHWAAACRGQKLEMYHPGPFDPLSQKEAERLRGVFESEVTGPALSPRNSFVFRRCFFSRSRLEGYGMSLLGVQGSDVVASLLCLDLAKICGVEVRLSFMQDMRLHLPSLRAYVGNFARLSEPRAAGGRTLEALAGKVASLRHGASGQWRSSARTSQGVLPGRPCHPSLKDPLFYLLMISSALVMIFEFLRHILRVCFFFEIGSVEAVFPERGEPLRFREVSELLPYDRVLRGYRMTHTLFFPYVVDEDRLKKSLSSTLAAYPSFASVIVECRGRTFLDWGDSKGVPFTVQTRRTPMRRKDFIHGSFQYAGDVSLAPDRWGAVRFFQKVRDAALSPWELLGRPALRVSVVRILSKPKGRWAPVQHSGGLNRIPASPNAAAGSENYPSSSYVTLAWSHALCDGPSMMAFLSHWAAACRGQKLEMYHPGPFDPLSQKEAERLRGVFESEVTGPALSPRNSFVFRRCFFSRSRLEGYGMSLRVFRAATWWPPCC